MNHSALSLVYILNPSCYLDFESLPSPQLRLFFTRTTSPLPLGEGRVRVFDGKPRKSMDGSNLGYLLVYLSTSSPRKQRQMPQCNNMHPLRAVTFGEDRCFRDNN